MLKRIYLHSSGPEQEAAVQEEEMPEAALETETEADKEGEDVSSEELYQQ